MLTSSCPFLWLNSDLLPADSPVITAQDRGLLLGDGLFETMQLRNRQASFLDAHLTRLEEGCRILRLPAPSRETVEAALDRLIAANNLTDGSARVTLTRGTGPRGLTPPAKPHTTLLITTAPLPEQPAAPVRLHVSAQRRDPQVVLNRVKSLNTLPAILARMDAREQGADDALWLTPEGEIAEATAANFLALMDGQVVTPPLSTGILPGISRARLLAASLCKERPLTETDIAKLQGAWLVTALSLTPIAAIGSQEIPLQPEQTSRLRHFLYDGQ
ncbi:aminotransferase class IV [Bombella sp. TMW 2.2559]|uniref:Probable branched-chain-amino-acid aminotransferase n=1 Tax=Bombella dulcis TaxID=2967339 RepID=A0ABT3WAF9_9PROT|nr:aminotransferase class IV [Bombella dulcis]MCX5616077.1 aminotransferase class IV [Bombella dulcis]